MRNRTNFVFLFILFSLSTNAFSLVFVDVDRFSFSKTGLEGIRVCVFDTDKQKYEYIGYHTHIDGKKPLNNNDEYHGCSIQYDGEVKLPKNFDKDKFIIRSIAKIIDPNEDSEDSIDTGSDGKYVVKPENIDTMYASYIQEKLIAKNQDDSENTFEIEFCSYKKNDSKCEQQSIKDEIGNDKATNTREKGIIGELATEYTMIGYGYKKYNSHNGSNQGFDGVFLDDSDNPELFLTESKCRNESCSAQKYLEEELNDSKIIKRFEEIPEEYEKTRKIVKRFIMKKPQQIFKFAHRMLKDGRFESAIEQQKPNRVDIVSKHFELLEGSNAQFKSLATYYHDITYEADIDYSSKYDVTEKVEWDSSNKAAAIVLGKPNNGIVVALHEGKTDIKVMMQDINLSDSKKLSVIKEKKEIDAEQFSILCSDVAQLKTKMDLYRPKPETIDSSIQSSSESE